ncbi:hypothetical protein Lal_00047096 [Lupinus albus]|nr:hypothetical protein Lal_00047096 [Lupinus albus]
MRSVCSIGSWNLKSGILRLFLRTQDFNLNQQKMSHTQCWVKIHNLPQDYWSPRIISSIVGHCGLEQGLFFYAIRWIGIKMLNKVVLLKLVWDIGYSNQDWAKFYRIGFRLSSYYPTRYFKYSIWPGIRDNWSLVNMNSIWLAGDGLQSNFWKDNWLGDSLIDIFGITQEINDYVIAKILWSKHIPSSKSFISWRHMHNRLPTDKNLAKRGCNLASICVFCKCGIEDSDHLFFNCIFAQELWNWLR